MSEKVVDRFRVDGRVAIVTGASSGLGVGIAEAYADAGGSVVVAARRANAIEKTAARIRERGGDAIAVTVDVADLGSCKELVQAASEQFGRVDALVNNAGLGGAHRAINEPEEHFRRIVEVNLFGTYWMSQACATVMSRGSAIVNVSSVLAVTTAGLPQAAYAASKSALLGLTRDLAQQWTGRLGIRVNTVLPGLFHTEMTEEYPPGYIDKVVESRVLAGRTGDITELASVVLFLCSDASSYMTGALVPVDGGLLLT
jgi:NAD(P)-dependent dehydrogenase (short-subunit alcohol dehydrogenase family)